MDHIDLFSGIGGFSLAAKWCGFQTIQFVEKDLFCRKVLEKNFPSVPIHTDIHTFTTIVCPVLLTGGFPCQPFSIAGKKKGTKDDRYLWPQMLRVIRDCKPSWVVAENVTGIVAMELDNILIDLEREGYESQAFIVPACAANAPHRRDRLWIVANRLRQRCNSGLYHREPRHIQKNKEWNMASLQSEWKKLLLEPWKTMQANDWLQSNADTSRINDGISRRVDRIKSLGNAIVPQVAYPILKLIYEIEKNII